jgi:hypothetical protein
MRPAASKQKSRREYQTHGDSYRGRLLKERGTDAIDGRTRAGKEAKAWKRFALRVKGGKTCSPDVKVKIDLGTFHLWRALEMQAYIVVDARKRGTPINKRRGSLPKINDQHDVLMGNWQRINDELKLDKPVDLARRLMQERAALHGQQNGVDGR